MAKPNIRQTISKKDWNKKHKDFKLMGKDGIHYIMAYDNKIGTHLVPVDIVNESSIDESFMADLDIIKQSSKSLSDFVKKVLTNKDYKEVRNDKDFHKYLKVVYTESVNEADTPCWDDYKLGSPKTKKSSKTGKRVNNCVPKSEAVVNEKEGVLHYTKDGKEWTGPTHKMPNGTLMTQNPHNDDSEKLFHKDELDETTQLGKVNEAFSKPNSVARKQIKSMFRIPAKEFKQGHNFYYYDKRKTQWYFVDFEGDLSELNNEYTLKQVNGYIKKNQLNINETTQLIERQLKGLDGIDSKTPLSKASYQQKLKIIQSTGNNISFKVPKGSSRNFWQVFSKGKIKTKQSMLDKKVYYLPGKMIGSPEFSSEKELVNNVLWDTMDDIRGFNESVNEDVSSDGCNCGCGGCSTSVNETTVNEVNGRLNKKVKTFLDKYFTGDDKNSPTHQFAVMHVLKGALIDANFHSEAKRVDKFFPKAKSVDNRYNRMIDVIQDKGIDIAKWAKWDGHEIIDAFTFYTNMKIGGGFGEKLQSLKEAYVVTYVKKKGDKPSSAAYSDKSLALRFEKDLKKDGYITMVSQKKIKGISEKVVNEGVEPDVIKNLRDIVKQSQNKKVKDPKSGKMIRVDLFTASAITQVYDGINKSQKDKFVQLGLAGMAKVSFKLIK